MSITPLKPKDQKRAPLPAVIKHVSDGREVCTDATRGRIEYRRRTLSMRARQGCLCCLCGLWMSEQETTFEHWDGRGHGGGHRDDRTEKDGKPYNGAAHGLCNAKKAGRRFGKFIEQERTA